MAIYMWRESNTIMYDQGTGEFAAQQRDIYSGTVPETGNWIFETQLKSTNAWSSHLSIYINGTLTYDFTKAGDDGRSSLMTQTLSLTTGDTVRLYGYHDLSGEVAYIKSTKIYKVNS